MEIESLIQDVADEVKNVSVVKAIVIGGTRFQSLSWLQVGSGKMALSRPAHQRVTHTVGQPLLIHMGKYNT